MKKSPLLGRSLKLLVVVGIPVVFWEAICYFHLVSPAVVAAPSEIVKVLPAFLPWSGNGPDLLSTLAYSVMAFVVSIPIGVGIGALVYYSALDEAQYVLDFMRSIPATALVPLFLLIIGLSDRTKLTVGAFSSCLVIGLATTRGLYGLNRIRQDIIRLVGLSRSRRVFLVDLPESAESIFIGLRAGISLSLILVVVTEMMVGGHRGLGRVISDMRFTDDKPRMYAAILVTGLVGYLLNSLLAKIETRLVHWRGK
jgi:ABC-type nitrate/sulfonate/bicarbonate transport system permease component